jgi:hypothetical protein
MASNVVSDNFETGTGGVPQLGGADRQTQWCKAWVNFNGQGTVAIRDSYNVSSVTDNTTGQYTINFSNNMANANYCAVANMSVNVDGTSAAIDSDVALRNYATSSVKFLAYSGSGGGWTDPAIGTVQVFGD